MLTSAWLWSHVPSYPGAELCNADGSPLPSTTPLALAQTHPAGNGSITRARASEAGCRDSPQGRWVLGKGRPVLLPQGTRPPGTPAKPHHFPLQPQRLTRLL